MTYLKNASITPGLVRVGDVVEFRVKVTIGSDFVSNGSRLMVDVPTYLGQSRPTKLDQEQPGFVTVNCSNPDLRYRERVWDIEIEDFPTRDRRSFMGMAARMIIVDLEGGEVQEGDTIEVIYGWTRNGFGPGAQVSILALEPDFEHHFDVRYFVDGECALPDFARSYKGYDRPTPDQDIRLAVKVQPREPERLRVLRQVDTASVLVLDRFANVCHQVNSEQFIEGPSGQKNAHGVIECADPAAAFVSKGLPIDDAPDMRKACGDYDIYFGDLHTHSSTSNDCIEREKNERGPDALMRYARDVSRLDFLAVTDHHQPWDIQRNRIGEPLWDVLLEAVEKNHEPGRFVAFPGFEYRCKRGDTAVVLGDLWPYEEVDIEAASDIRKLWEVLRGRNYLTIPHFHNPGSLEPNEWWACPYDGIEPYLEIYSCHGSYERADAQERHIPECKAFRPDRTGEFFLKNGYHYGFGCNSDGHKGHVGMNGITAVFAKERTREAIFEAIRVRRVYGTTNAHMRLVFTINGALMGSILPNVEEKVLRVEASGEQPIKSVDIFRDGELFKRIRPERKTVTEEFDVGVPEASSWYVRAMQVDNHMAYSSPIWFE